MNKTNSKRFPFAIEECVLKKTPLSRRGAADIKDRKPGLNLKRSHVAQWIVFEAPRNLPKQTYGEEGSQTHGRGVSHQPSGESENTDRPERSVLE